MQIYSSSLDCDWIAVLGFQMIERHLLDSAWAFACHVGTLSLADELRKVSFAQGHLKQKIQGVPKQQILVMAYQIQICFNTATAHRRLTRIYKIIPHDL